MSLTKQISARDKARTGKSYYRALRGYHQRKDILEAMFKSLNINKLNKQRIQVIDLGCGPGIVGLYFNKKMKGSWKLDITFVDINPLMLEAIPKQKNFHVVERDVTKIDTSKFNFFDVALMKQLLDYLPKDLQIKTLENTYKILHRDGQFILSVLIPPSEESFQLNNALYSEREKILNPLAPIKKFIVTKDILFQWLSKIGFKNIKYHYEYDIPLSVNDFVMSFGLNETEKQELLALYKKIVKQDINNAFKSKIKKEDIELTEKGIIVFCYK